MGVVKLTRCRKARKSSTCPACGAAILPGQLIASVGHGPWQHAAHLIEEQQAAAG